MDEVFRSIDEAVKQGTANGLNAATDKILQHIKDAVPVRTGALRDSYAVVRRANPDDLETEVDSEKPYAIRFYPLTDSFGKVPRLGGTARPTLFGSPDANQRKSEIVRTEIEKAVIDAIQRLG